MSLRIYVASSWRNETRQQAVVKALRADGHDVYDFRNPAPGDHGFAWRQCASKEQLRDARKFRDEVLTHPIAEAGFEKDMDALAEADVCVLVLPCGRSAHLELGYAIGACRTMSIVLLDDPLGEPELMYLAASVICVNLEEVRASIKEFDATGIAELSK